MTTAGDIQPNKDWILHTIGHRETGKVPYNFMFSPPVQESLEQHYGTLDVVETLNFPIRMTAPISVKPLYAHPGEYGPTITDEFGVVWSTSEIDRGAPIGPPLHEPDLTHYTFPDAAQPYRFEGVAEWCRNNRSNFTVVMVGDLWERATFMRGMENILLDVSQNPGFTEALLRGIAEYILKTMLILFEDCEFDAIGLSDDYGTQNGLLLSPVDWKRIVKPVLNQIYALAKKKGFLVFHHSCGEITELIPDMIDIGLDILHPIQPEAMDILNLKREFGSDLTFCGGLNTQQLLPFEKPAKIRDAVRRLKREMGKGGGYILEPGITIQADVPLRNVVAMIEEAQKRP
jgi:uroporphyrinogen decarboxylase